MTPVICIVEENSQACQLVAAGIRGISAHYAYTRMLDFYLEEAPGLAGIVDVQVRPCYAPNIIGRFQVHPDRMELFSTQFPMMLANLATHREADPLANMPGVEAVPDEQKIVRPGELQGRN